jgi:hypothetical protein
MNRKCSQCGREITVAGVIFCPFCNKALVKFDPAPPPVSEEPLKAYYNEKKFREDWSQARLISGFVTVCCYLTIVGTIIDPDVRRKFELIFGPAPIGISPVALAWALETILFLPFPWVAYHFGLIILQSRRDGLAPGFLSVLFADEYHPHLSRSKWICIGGLIYWFLIGGIWIVYSVRPRD